MIRSQLQFAVALASIVGVSCLEGELDAPSDDQSAEVLARTDEAAVVRRSISRHEESSRVDVEDGAHVDHSAEGSEASLLEHLTRRDLVMKADGTVDRAHLAGFVRRQPPQLRVYVDSSGIVTPHSSLAEDAQSELDSEELPMQWMVGSSSVLADGPPAVPQAMASVAAQVVVANADPAQLAAPAAQVPLGAVAPVAQPAAPVAAVRAAPPVDAAHPMDDPANHRIGEMTLLLIMSCGAVVAIAVIFYMALSIPSVRKKKDSVVLCMLGAERSPTTENLPAGSS